MLFKGDSLTTHLGRKFGTRDTHGCAVTHKGAWWYHACFHSNLNGLYLRGNHTSYADGVNWIRWKGLHYSLRFTAMKIRPF